MCDFVSWIECSDPKEKTKHILFLTAHDVFQTKRGKELRAFCGNEHDYVGHGAIRYYYGLSSDSGKDKECTDFSMPNNFPPEIVTAIKSGKMRGLEINHTVTEMLLPSVVARCFPLINAQDKHSKAWDAFGKAQGEYGKAWDAFNKAENEYNKARDGYGKTQDKYNKAQNEYNKAWDGYGKAQDEYGKVQDEYVKVRDEYNKVLFSCFWDMFENPENRKKCWR